MAQDPYRTGIAASAPGPASSGDDPYGTGLVATPPPPRMVPGKGVAAHDPALIRRLLAGLQWAADSPVGHGLDAILNATSRAGTAAVAGRNPAKAIIDPASATELAHGAEHNVLHHGLGIPDIPPELYTNPWVATPLRFGQVGLDLATETALDPAMYVPGLDLWSLTKHLGRAARGAADVAATVPGVSRAVSTLKPVTEAASRVADRAKLGVVEGHDLRKGVTRAGEDIIKGREIAGHDVVRRAEQTYGDLIEKHRAELDAIDEQRKNIALRLSELHSLAKAGHQKSILEANALQRALDDTTNRVPGEIRTALLRRAYLEGTPEVRRQVIARGFVPSAEDRDAPVLNILHGFNTEYEPTQKVFKAEDLAGSTGPVRYVRAGRRATFDLRKEGARPDDPLADRLLDRLVRGARITNRHNTDRQILNDLGLAPLPVLNTQRTLAAIEAARVAGDTAKAERYEKLLAKQDAALKAAEEKRAATLKPGTDAEATQTLEILDPLTARHRAARDMRRAGELVEKGPPLRPRSTPRDTRFLQGRLVGGRRAMIDADQFTRLAEAAARRAAGAAARGERASQSAAQRLFGSAIRAKAETTRRLGPLFPQPPRGAILDPEGRPINVPRTAQPFNDVKIMPPAPRSLEPKRGPAAPILGPSGQPIRKPTLAERQQASILRPIGKLTEQIGAQAAQRPSFRNLIAPSQRAAQAAAKRESKVVRRYSGTASRLVSEEERNAAIEEVRKRADALATGTNVVAMPEAVQRRLFGAKAVYENSLARDFSDLQRDALFVLPFAHMKNITVLALLGPKGPKVVAAGARYAKTLKDDPASLEHRVLGLEQIGASSHYLRDVDPVYAKIPDVGKPIADFAQRGNAALERYDMGMRMALEDELKAQGKTGFTAGGEIRDVLGDYENQAPLIRELRARYGANFPAWRLGVVPRAMTKALRENPRAMKTYARLERLFSDDVTAPIFGGDLDVGGPVEDAASAVIPKPALSNFWTSPSTLGWPSLLFGLLNAASKGRPAEEVARQALRVLPFGNLVSAATGFPYPSNAPAALRAASAVGGIYYPNRPTIKQRANQLRGLGMKAPEVQAVLRSEGYYAQPALAPLPAIPPDPYATGVR